MLASKEFHFLANPIGSVSAVATGLWRKWWIVLVVMQIKTRDRLLFPWSSLYTRTVLAS